MTGQLPLLSQPIEMLNHGVGDEVANPFQTSRSNPTSGFSSEQCG